MNFGDGSEVKLFLPSEKDFWNKHKETAAGMISLSTGAGEDTGAANIGIYLMKFINVKGHIRQTVFGGYAHVSRRRP
jgi:hypothetical protein